MEDFFWITNPKKLKEFRLRFNVYDHQRNGIVKVRDLLTVLKDMGQKITKYQLEEMMREAALDDYDDIHYDEFLLMVSKKESEDEIPEEVLDAFLAFDNGKGFLEVKELRKILTTLGDKLSEEEVDEMLKEAKTKDGKIKIVDKGLPKRCVFKPRYPFAFCRQHVPHAICDPCSFGSASTQSWSERYTDR